MKLTIYQTTDDNDQCVEHLYINDKYWGTVGGGEPEDNCIGRDLISFGTIAELMQKAYDAAKKGEELVVQYLEGDGPEN